MNELFIPLNLAWDFFLSSLSIPAEGPWIAKEHILLTSIIAASFDVDSTGQVSGEIIVILSIIIRDQEKQSPH